MLRRALSRWTMLTLLLGTACIGCNAIIGGAIAAVGITAAMVFRGCDDYVGVTVRRQGRVVCDAEVVARSEGREVDFSPCFAAYLPDGTWQIEATAPSGGKATSTVIVEHPDACEPSVHTVELTLPGAAAAPSSEPSSEAATPSETAPSPPAPPMKAEPTSPGEAAEPAPKREKADVAPEDP